MAKSRGKTISLKCFSNEEEVADVLTVTGSGDYAVGLTSEGRVFSCKTNDKPNCKQICVPLFKLTIWPTEGVTLTPVNRDLACIIDEQEIISEMNLLSGMKVEIGDKMIEYQEGPVPRARRHLPPTPGVNVRMSPPPKPVRNGTPTQPQVEQKEPQSPELLKEWCLIEVPYTENELINRLTTKEEIASMSASYINKQIHQYTDTRLSAAMMDEVFSMLQDVGTYRKDMLKIFLSDMAREDQTLNKSEEGFPLHAPVIQLLVEILKQFMDPVSHVVLCLKLLRALSHVPSNISTFIACRAPAAVLGSMSVYVDEVDVQLNGTDILCKLSVYTPIMGEKAPLRESAVELITRAMQRHKYNLLIIQSGCRVLASLSLVLFEQANNITDNERRRSSSLVNTADKLVNLLEFISQHVTGIIHDVMKDYLSDFNVTLEGRRFLYVMARLDQLKRKHALWLESRCEQEEEDEPADSEGQGILKRSRSYESLRSSERRVSFVEESGPGVYDSTSEDSAGSDVDRVNSPVEKIKMNQNEPELKSRSDSASSNMSNDYEGDIRSSSGLFNHSVESLTKMRSDSQLSSQSVENVKNRSDSNLSNSSAQSCTTKDIAEGLGKPTDAPGTNDNVSQTQEPMLIQDYTTGGKPDVVVSTMSVDSGVSLFSELSQMDPHMTPVVEHEHQDVSTESLNSEEEDGDEEINYSSGDIEFLNRLVKTKIVCRVCSLAFMDEDKEAYAIMEKPVRDVLETEKMSPALLRFFISQYKPDLSLMDFDPNIVISLIDAIRYRSQVAPGVIQKMLLSVARSVNRNVNIRQLKLGASILRKILEEPSLLLTVSDANFHNELRAELENSCQSLPDPSMFSDVLSKLTPGHSLMDLDCY